MQFEPNLHKGDLISSPPQWETLHSCRGQPLAPPIGGNPVSCHLYNIRGFPCCRGQISHFTAKPKPVLKRADDTMNLPWASDSLCFPCLGTILPFVWKGSNFSSKYLPRQCFLLSILSPSPINCIYELAICFCNMSCEFSCLACMLKQASY